MEKYPGENTGRKKKKKCGKRDLEEEGERKEGRGGWWGWGTRQKEEGRGEV